MFKTLRSRLTLLHAIIFAFVALGVMGFAYFTVSNQFMAFITEDLQDTAHEFIDAYEVSGMSELHNEITRESLLHGVNDFSARFINTSGKTLIQAMPQTWKFPLPLPEFSDNSEQWFEIVVNNKGEEAKIVSVPIQGHGWIQIGLSLKNYHFQMNHIQRGFEWALLLIVMVGIITGWWLVSRALSGVELVRRTAMNIGDGDFESRLNLTGHGQELVELAEAFNLMLDKIQKLLKDMRDVSDNIAHDLRTPITRIRCMAETGLMTKKGHNAECEEALADIVPECERLSALINTMLEIAQTDSGVMTMEHKPVDMAKLLYEVCDLFSPVAGDSNIELKLELQSDHLTVLGDKPRLQRLMANLVDNAIKFSPAGSHITLTADKQENLIRLFVTDHGMGIAEDDMAHIFERFYRSDRSRSMPGNGLGLSYAKSIITAHGGEICIHSQPKNNTTVCVTLPSTSDEKYDQTANFG